jgi:hypothetical protein
LDSSIVVPKKISLGRIICTSEVHEEDKMKRMIIKRLELANYKRMSLAGIVRFVFTPDDQYALQTILGTNGSGKSSLQN